jgi:thiopurine S-methyltransferase
LFARNLLPKLVASNQQQCVVFSLCGKTLDMKAVLDAGHRVIGIEGSPIAAEAFFKENNIPYETETDETNKYQIYKVNI